jgi:DNA mismatch repair protein MutL
MVHKIKILPESLIKRIAAGEVVERPASVVKELIENALDAGADQIDLIIKESGIKQIQVVDNGSGMNEEDAVLCSSQHATSKISSPKDLDIIETFGFRGEALSSIGSVSRMKIVTCSDQKSEGTQVKVEGGVIGEVEKVAAKQGTSVLVKDLFYNVPARRKFLKSSSTELRHVISVFRRFALSYEKVNFSLTIDSAKTMDLTADTQENRIRELLGEEKFIHLIPVHEQMGGVEIKGYIGKPGEGHRSRTDQFFFLNRRYIISKVLTHGVLSAYGPRLNRNEYPIYVLFIQMDPSRFDVNVHPMKMEVRFREERLVHDVLHRAVQNAFKSSQVVPELKLVMGSKGKKTIKNQDMQDYRQLMLEMQRPIIGEEVVEYTNVGKEMPILTQLHNRYILSQIKSGLTIIDQHVAHERILYEKAQRARQLHAGQSQQLLFPQTVELNAEDFLILTEVLPYLERIGFGLKEFGKNVVIIEAVPVDIRTGQERELLLEIIHEYKNLRVKNTDSWDAVAKAFACKSAIKSGEKLTLQEMASLIDQLFTTKEPYFCPHGRPIIVNLTLEELDKRFGR